MDGLAFDLKTIALGSGEGSYLTRTQRHWGLQLVARELRTLGYKLPSAGSLKPRHVEALVGHWKVARLSAGTLKNRMSWLRFWAQKVRKSNVIPRENEALGIEQRRAFNGNRARISDAELLKALPERMQLAMKLQMAFGLRLEESLKFRPAQADQGDAIALQSSWCKGGRARTVPLTHERQRALLDQVKAFVGNGSLIPEGTKYITYRRDIEHQALAAGFRGFHASRHWYAQWRYKTLTGRPCPAAGGATYERLSRADRAADYRARMQISGELGHARLSITDTYLGSRFAAKAGK